MPTANEPQERVYGLASAIYRKTRNIHRNAKIKFCEPFRPSAPSVLAERTEEYFVLPEAAKHYPGRFMLYVGDVREDKRDTIPAVTHVDGTGRLQSVHKKVIRRYSRLIDAFGGATRVPELLSMSFDLKDEPIVNTPQKAFQTFTHSGMDVLVLGNHRFPVRRTGQLEGPHEHLLTFPNHLDCILSHTSYRKENRGSCPSH